MSAQRRYVVSNKTVSDFYDKKKHLLNIQTFVVTMESEHCLSLTINNNFPWCTGRGWTSPLQQMKVLNC